MDVGKHGQHSQVILFVFVIRQNLVIIDIKYDDLNYRITQQQKALTISELLGKGIFNIYCWSIKKFKTSVLNSLPFHVPDYPGL